MLTGLRDMNEKKRHMKTSLEVDSFSADEQHYLTTFTRMPSEDEFLKYQEKISRINAIRKGTEIESTESYYQVFNRGFIPYNEFNPKGYPFEDYRTKAENPIDCTQIKSISTIKKHADLKLKNQAKKNRPS